MTTKKPPRLRLTLTLILLTLILVMFVAPQIPQSITTSRLEVMSQEQQPSSQNPVAPREQIDEPEKPSRTGLQTALESRREQRQQQQSAASASAPTQPQRKTRQVKYFDRVVKPQAPEDVPIDRRLTGNSIVPDIQDAVVVDGLADMVIYQSGGIHSRLEKKMATSEVPIKKAEVLELAGGLDKSERNFRMSIYNNKGSAMTKFDASTDALMIERMDEILTKAVPVIREVNRLNNSSTMDDWRSQRRIRWMKSSSLREARNDARNPHDSGKQKIVNALGGWGFTTNQVEEVVKVVMENKGQMKYENLETMLSSMTDIVMANQDQAFADGYKSRSDEISKLKMMNSVLMRLVSERALLEEALEMLRLEAQERERMVQQQAVEKERRRAAEAARKKVMEEAAKAREEAEKAAEAQQQELLQLQQQAVDVGITAAREEEKALVEDLSGLSLVGDVMEHLDDVNLDREIDLSVEDTPSLFSRIGSTLFGATVEEPAVPEVIDSLSLSAMKEKYPAREMKVGQRARVDEQKYQVQNRGVFQGWYAVQKWA